MPVDTVTHVTVQGTSTEEQVQVQHTAPARGIPANSVHVR
jgi:hypothetical protein